MATEMGLVEKSGAWYSHDGDRIGQGRENAKIFENNPEIASKIEEKIREKAKDSEDNEEIEKESQDEEISVD